MNLCHFPEELLLQMPAPQTVSAIQGKDFYAAMGSICLKRGFVNAEMFLTKYHIAWYCCMGGKNLTCRFAYGFYTVFLCAYLSNASSVFPCSSLVFLFIPKAFFD